MFVFTCSYVTVAQSFPSEKYKSEKITWLGLDFTLAKLVDQFAFTNPPHLVSHYIPAWNSFVNTESSKYDVRKYLRKSDMKIDLDFTNNYNGPINPDNLVQGKIYSLESDLVRKDTKKYNSTGLEGIGVVLYVESFNKNILLASFWFTLIDLKSGDVLFMDKISGKPGGFGVRNYWAGAFLKSLKSINGKMPKWLD
jgi:hypothetical protein